MARKISKRKGWSYAAQRYEAQEGPEYMITIALAIALVLLAAYTIFNIFSGTGNLAGSYCHFDIGVVCADFLVGSNTSSTMFALLGSNSQPYPMANLSLNVTLAGASTTSLCTPATINPGQSFLCIMRLNTYAPMGSRVSGNITAHVSYCGLSGGNCASAVPQNYVGRFLTTSTGYNIPTLNLTLGHPVSNPNGTRTQSVALSIVGHNFTLSNVNVQQNNQSVVVFNSTNAYVVQAQASNNTAPCTGKTVNSSVSSISSKSKVGVWSKLINVSSVSIAGKGNNESFVLINRGNIAESGNSNFGCVVVRTLAQISASLSGGRNTLRIFNGNMKVSVSGNNNVLYLKNVTASQLTVSGTTNNVYLQASGASNVTLSGNNNNLYVQSGSTIGSKTISGTNDTITIG